MKRMHILVIVDNLKDGTRFHSCIPAEPVVTIAGMK